MQRIRIDAASLQRPGALSHALLAVVPAFLNHPATQAAGTSLTIFLVSGLLCAIGFGWLRRTLGTLKYTPKKQRKSYPSIRAIISQKPPPHLLHPDTTSPTLTSAPSRPSP